MKGGDLNELADRIETVVREDAAADDEVANALSVAFRNAAAARTTRSGLLRSTDAALHAVDATVPGWEISIRGIAREPDGHWTCTLRETSATDEDAVIGIGRSPALPCALIAALLRVGAVRLPR